MAMSFQHPFQEVQFEIFDWYPKYKSCLEYFHETAQHTNAVQAVAASINIRLPFQQKPSTPSLSPPAATATATAAATATASTNVLSVVPYVRRLVATGFDSPPILHGFFGDDWPSGIGPIHENERRNYLFAAKSETWLRVKASYDMEDDQTIPFLRPLQAVTEREIQIAEASWSEWLAMQDWMLGPRAPENGAQASGVDR